MNLDNKFGGGFMSIPETNLTNETVVDIKKHIGNKNNKPKQVLGEKKIVKKKNKQKNYYVKKKKVIILELD